MEDEGEGICFNVFVYNVQPGVVIDYATGENWSDGTMDEGTSGVATGSAGTDSGAAGEGAGAGGAGAESAFDATQHAYVLNANTRRIHVPTCPSVEDAKSHNLQGWDGTVEEAEALGYQPCGRCRP